VKEDARNRGSSFLIGAQSALHFAQKIKPVKFEQQGDCGD
jgi:hypothetical protein